MKEDINLLPPPAIRIHVRRLYSKRLQHICTALIIALLIVVAAEGSSLFVLNQTSARLQAAQAQDSLTTTLADDLQKYNEIVREITKQKNGTMPWSHQTESVLAAVPSGLSVTHLDADMAANTLTIKAIASSRDASLIYKQALETLPWIEHIDAPLQNFALADKNEITFTITRKLP